MSPGRKPWALAVVIVTIGMFILIDGLVASWLPGSEGAGGQEEEREGKAEQEAYMRGADRAEGRRQLALHGIARGLRRRGDQRKDGPEHCVDAGCVLRRRPSGSPPRRRAPHRGCR